MRSLKLAATIMLFIIVIGLVGLCWVFGELVKALRGGE